MKYQHQSVRKMQITISLLVFVCLSMSNCETVDTDEPSKSTSAPGSKVTDHLRDLDLSASSDHAFILSRDYGYGSSSIGSGSYGGRRDSVYDSSFGGYPSVGGGSVYRSGNTYRGSELTPVYRGHQVGGYGNGIIGGGHTGYGYYGSTGYSSDYGGYGTGGQSGYGGIGSGLYDTDYPSYGGTRGGHGGGYGDGYGDGYDGSYSRGYEGQDTAGYDPYRYRGSVGHGPSSGYKRYGGYDYQPSGYRGYS